MSAESATGQSEVQTELQPLIATEDVARSDGQGQPVDVATARRGRPRLRLEEIAVGAERDGKVMAVSSFGLFVDIGAVTDGLVHISELPRRRSRKAGAPYKLGDRVAVWVKDVDLRSNRISLSMRPRPARPMRELHVGDILYGTITSVTKYGAFVEIGAETEGLVHVSQLSAGYVEKPSEVVQAGETVQVRIRDIDLRRERISLSMAGLASDRGVVARSRPGRAAPAAAAVEERQPTVVEIALRKALAEQDPPIPDGGDGRSAGQPGRKRRKRAAEAAIDDEEADA